MRNQSAVEIAAARPSTELSEREYVQEILTGVSRNISRIDELIITYAQGWDLDRMPSIDRNLLRIALYEILWSETVDDKVAVSEAVALAKELSTEESSGYINGVLGRIIALKASLVL